ncbi:FAD-dependent oxidoreductase [Novosphingobium lentum]|uniref:FAD-dependent oxidoreductase n=1 Tax=Novosphingobium lentum TaxID=145287 RepID=UPI00082CBBC8|nr:FAD-dependent oxidoreductase [Novosphingobium lentum]
MATDFDVIIVGGGGAGLAAAIEATKLGASCIVLEADTKLGGATALSAGVFYAADTSVQREAGVEGDTADAMFTYVMAVNQWALKPDVIRLICDESGPTVEWLRSLGTRFIKEFLVVSGVDDMPRGHSSEGAGGGIADALINAAGALGVQTALGTRVERLLFEDGRVTGVHAGGMDLHGAVTIITTGGFGNSPEMIAKHFPTAAQHGSWTWAVHDPAPFILGDGITLGEQVGAGIAGHDTGLLLPTSGVGKFVEAFLPPWIMMVNEDGRRFAPETSSYTVCGYLINEQTNAHAFAIFDDPTMLEASNDSSYLDPYNSGLATPTWEEATLRKRIASGDVKVADTLVELAAKCGIDGAALVETARRYNADIADGVDRQFFKKAKKLFTVETGPFYAVEVKAAIIGVTGAGLDADRQCRVLDTHGVAIPGLYGAGEVLGVLQGKRYAGGGFSIGPAVILGREAGRQAAVEALSHREAVA